MYILIFIRMALEHKQVCLMVQDIIKKNTMVAVFIILVISKQYQVNLIHLLALLM